MVNKPITVYDAEGMTIGHKLVYKDWQARENVRSHVNKAFLGLFCCSSVRRLVAAHNKSNGLLIIDVKLLIVLRSFPRYFPPFVIGSWSNGSRS